MKTGIIGHGWLGKPLKKELEVNGISCFATSVSKPKEEQKIFPYLLGEKLPSQFKSLETIVLCAPPSFRRNDPEIVLKNYELLFEQISESTKIIYTSSTSVYQNSGIQNESSACSGPIYSIEKMITHRFKNNLILRLGGLAGPNRTIVNILSQKKLLNNYNAPSNLLHLHDAVNTLKIGVLKDIKGTYNIVTPEHPLKLDVYNSWCQKLSLPILSPGTPFTTSKTVVTDKWITKTGYKFEFNCPKSFTF